MNIAPARPWNCPKLTGRDGDGASEESDLYSANALAAAASISLVRARPLLSSAVLENVQIDRSADFLCGSNPGFSQRTTSGRLARRFSQIDVVIAVAPKGTPNSTTLILSYSLYQPLVSRGFDSGLACRLWRGAKTLGMIEDQALMADEQTDGVQRQRPAVESQPIACRRIFSDAACDETQCFARDDILALSRLELIANADSFIEASSD